MFTVYVHGHYSKYDHLVLFLFCCLVKPVIDRVKECRLTSDDFEVLEVIGRGAFGEVKVRLINNNSLIIYYLCVK